MRTYRPRTTGRTKLSARLEEKLGVTPSEGNRSGGVRYYDVARMIGTSPEHLGEWINGKCDIPWYFLMELCMLLECAPEDLLGDV